MSFNKARQSVKAFLDTRINSHNHIISMLSYELLIPDLEFRKNVIIDKRIHKIKNFII
jgi:hypothetical protein